MSRLDPVRNRVGRFHAARRGYSLLRRSLQACGLDRRPPLLSDNYEVNYKILPRRGAEAVIGERSRDEYVALLRRHAFADGLRLAEDVQRALIESATTRPLVTFARRRRFTLSDAAADPSVRSEHAIATVTDSSDLGSVQDVAGAPPVFEVVCRYLGYAPRHVSSWLFWSFANDLSDAAREEVYQTIRYHHDVHGFNFLYVNFYLSDTDADSGAHVLIRGSHRDKRWRNLVGSVRLSDEDALRQYGSERVVVVEGRAGSGFFEDASCYHKALAPRTRDRLLLQLRYW